MDGPEGWPLHLDRYAALQRRPHRHGIGKILVPLMIRRQAHKEMPGNMAALKQKIEAG